MAQQGTGRCRVLQDWVWRQLRFYKGQDIAGGLRASYLTLLCFSRMDALP